MSYVYKFICASGRYVLDTHTHIKAHYEYGIDSLAKTNNVKLHSFTWSTQSFSHRNSVLYFNIKSNSITKLSNRDIIIERFGVGFELGKVLKMENDLIFELVLFCEYVGGCCV